MTNVQFNNNYDVFHSFLVENADYDSYFELPQIKTSNQLPDRVITFSKAMSKTWNDFDCWVVFYEHDRNFERVWNNPKQYLPKLKGPRGVVSPRTFSLYRNMPLVYAAVERLQGQSPGGVAAE